MYLIESCLGDLYSYDEKEKTLTNTKTNFTRDAETLEIALNFVNYCGGVKELVKMED